MRNHVRHSRSERTSAFEEGHERDLALAGPGADDAEDFPGGDAEFAADADLYEEADGLADTTRVICPDCARPIALRGGEESLPVHAVCATPWNPFGVTVCAGSGRAAGDAPPLIGGAAEEQEGAEPAFGAVLALPAGLDWRTQPFSHVGGPGSRPIRLPAQRRLAA
jgi:hypothetical protein